ncbi:MAG TPA: bifunctional phosphopantothenoylcysteine decarboxylase/phosphopantothenate--cysteine ligase CoaBC [Pyrinomonadaceae bacterium]|nr:bifunctional phosphopantothenoylcysteine decarboxylase/phosphopantothenate--cysteine ligase CoaBC [Pyrinomonadaceae bacterium]
MAKYRVGLGVSGGIAAYKAIEVMRLLQKDGCEVSVAMTRHATEFIRPLTFRALTDSHVIVDDYDPGNPDPIAHINFSQSIDLLLIVPATANTIAKFANGVADDFLSSTYLACTAQVLIAPAMNTTMWEQPATQRNITRLKEDGVHFVEPIAGELACKTVGTGKLEDVENIVAQARVLLDAGGEMRNAERGMRNPISSLDDTPPASIDLALQASIDDAPLAVSEDDDGIPHSAFRVPHSEDLAGERLLITVGGTREPIDPVRFISNHSSGKMGFAVAEAARDRGAEVTIVAGVTTAEPPEDVFVVRAISAQEMHDAVMKELKNATIFIGAAAVADYTPTHAAAGKIKKDEKDEMLLLLRKTPDILADVSKNRTNGLLVVGFAAETTDVLEYARSKMKKKNLDMVVANDITQDGAGFNTDTNIATIITDSEEIDVPLMSKRELADIILDEVVRKRVGG